MTDNNEESPRSLAYLKTAFGEPAKPPEEPHDYPSWWINPTKKVSE